MLKLAVLIYQAWPGRERGRRKVEQIRIKHLVFKISFKMAARKLVIVRAAVKLRQLVPLLDNLD